MIPSENLFLIGLMGAGKTTIGRLLARHRGQEFIDTDHAIEACCGVSIATIFEIEGEAGFRKREVAKIDELSQRHGVVLATGGGAVLDPVNRDHLRTRGTVVYLSCAPEELYLRTRHDRNRPLLQTEDPLARLVALHQQRHPLYLETADLVLESGRQSAHCLVRKLEAALAESGGHPSPSTSVPSPVSPQPGEFHQRQPGPE